MLMNVGIVKDVQGFPLDLVGHDRSFPYKVSEEQPAKMHHQRKRLIFHRDEINIYEIGSLTCGASERKLLIAPP